MRRGRLSTLAPRHGKCDPVCWRFTGGHGTSCKLRRYSIDGDWRPASSGATIPVIDPSDGQPFTAIAQGTGEDIDRAVAAARRAFDGAWGKVSAADRGRMLARLSRG